DVRRAVECSRCVAASREAEVERVADWSSVVAQEPRMAISEISGLCAPCAEKAGAVADDRDTECRRVVRHVIDGRRWPERSAPQFVDGLSEHVRATIGLVAPRDHDFGAVAAGSSGECEDIPARENLLWRGE